MFVPNPEMEAVVEQKTAALKALQDDVYPKMSQLELELRELREKQTEEVVEYILSHSAYSMHEQVKAEELYLLEKSSSQRSVDDVPIYYALTSVMGVGSHPYLNNDYMVNHPDCPILGYALNLPVAENVSHDDLKSMVLIIEPVIEVQYVIARHYDVKSVPVRCLMQNSLKGTIHYDGASWCFVSYGDEENAEDAVKHDCLHDALLHWIGTEAGE